MCVAYAEQSVCAKTDEKKIIGDIVEQAACRDLDVGEKKVVNFETSDSPSTVEHKYILEKVKPDEYRVKLNLHFKEDKMFPDKPTKVGRRMQTRINKCLEDINPKLRGPDGEKLKIELIPWAEKHLPEYKDIKSLISVTNDKEAMPHSHGYRSNEECSVILHELLHLMGLVDEYPYREEDMFKADCRAIGPADSVMQEVSAVDWESMVVRICSCGDPKKCQAYSKEEIKTMKECPYGYGTMTTGGYFLLKGETADGDRLEAKVVSRIAGIEVPMVEIKPNEFRLPLESVGRIPNSVLYPAHFRSIIFPGCRAKNSVYYSCARDAYHQPWKWVGCREKPAICSDSQEWLK